MSSNPLSYRPNGPNTLSRHNSLTATPPHIKSMKKSKSPSASHPPCPRCHQYRDITYGMDIGFCGCGSSPQEMSSNPFSYPLRDPNTLTRHNSLTATPPHTKPIKKSQSPGISLLSSPQPSPPCAQPRRDRTPPPSTIQQQDPTPLRSQRSKRTGHSHRKDAQKGSSLDASEYNCLIINASPEEFNLVASPSTRKRKAETITPSRSTKRLNLDSQHSPIVFNINSPGVVYLHTDQAMPTFKPSIPSPPSSPPTSGSDGFPSPTTSSSSTFEPVQSFSPSAPISHERPNSTREVLWFEGARKDKTHTKPSTQHTNTSPSPFSRTINQHTTQHTTASTTDHTVFPTFSTTTKNQSIPGLPSSLLSSETLESVQSQLQPFTRDGQTGRQLSTNCISCWVAKRPITKPHRLTACPNGLANQHDSDYQAFKKQKFPYGICWSCAIPYSLQRKKASFSSTYVLSTTHIPSSQVKGKAFHIGDNPCIWSDALMPLAYSVYTDERIRNQGYQLWFTNHGMDLQTSLTEPKSASSYLDWLSSTDEATGLPFILSLFQFAHARNGSPLR
ncbi:hypothetical protein BDN72DRAFT_901240 [Pluteus cervinus]|uniref:Uncharacterized protein n=1 Tax=Pluteus cervinus TaxID=181527 RepID=A0ACD3AGY0_9AGAR|nr:hypothetical protein BDN72DRAFT_901240 [Pluteus cervinus]